MKRSQFYLYLLLILIVPGCNIIGPKIGFKKSDIGVKFSSSYNSDFDSKIDIDGYYFLDEPYETAAFALYKDGTYLPLYFNLKWIKKNINRSTNKLDSVIWINKERKPSFGGGIYKIEGDTLYIHSFYKFYSLPWSYIWEYSIEKYIIEDANTLRLVGGVIMDNIRSNIRRYEANSIYRFVKASPLPSPFEAEVKTKKWMWENKDDWKAYMIELNKYLDRKVAKDTVR
ncbi:MAG: hypothetical protein K2I52_04065 [Muribaculaceae bacterium]|nr:hypothetical protein [Muribaculaceae bacterium]